MCFDCKHLSSPTEGLCCWCSARTKTISVEKVFVFSDHGSTEKEGWWGAPDLTEPYLLQGRTDACHPCRPQPNLPLMASSGGDPTTHPSNQRSLLGSDWILSHSKFVVLYSLAHRAVCHSYGIIHMQLQAIIASLCPSFYSAGQAIPFFPQKWWYPGLWSFPPLLYEFPPTVFPWIAVPKLDTVFQLKSFQHWDILHVLFSYPSKTLVFSKKKKKKPWH